MRIVLCYPVQAQHIAQIQQVAPSAEIVDAGQERIAAEILSADIYCGHAKVPVPWDQVVKQGRLQWIQSSAAGMDHCLVPEVVDSDILVTSASGVLANQVSEHAMALTTALCRSLPVFFRAQQKKEFIRRPTGDLHGKTLGIVGFGGVGRRLAEVFRPMAGRILATDYFPIRKPDYVESLLPPESLPELLQEVDILLLSAPLTARTRHMINAQTLSLLQPGKLLVNMARGALVVHDDLVEALRSGHLAGAALDVTDPEPLPPESPLWEMPNVIITPHVAGQTARRIEDMTDFFCANLERYLHGGTLKNVVEKDLGFPRPAE